MLSFSTSLFSILGLQADFNPEVSSPIGNRLIDKAIRNLRKSG